VTTSAKDVAPASGVPTDFSARGRARPTRGRIAAVPRAPCGAASAAAAQASAVVAPADACSRNEAANGSSASSRVLSPAAARPRSWIDSAKASMASATCSGP
jgi:hypothetical protein